MSYKIGFIGAGNMATAIIEGMIKDSKKVARKIYVYDVDFKKMLDMEEKGINTIKDPQSLVRKSDIIVLAVKPQNYSDVLEDIKKQAKDKKVFVSIAAGISSEYIKEILDCNCPIVRVMPNTPLLVGKGATALSYTEGLEEEAFNTIYSMFANGGIAEVIPEEKMNAIIAINGSSPAYIYLLAKAMEDFAKEEQIDKEIALNLICATLEGSAEMLRNSGDTSEELIKKVSSPGGTTIAALEKLDEYDFYNGIIEAMKACTNRAEELGS